MQTYEYHGILFEDGINEYINSRKITRRISFGFCEKGHAIAVNIMVFKRGIK